MYFSHRSKYQQKYVDAGFSRQLALAKQREVFTHIETESPIVHKFAKVKKFLSKITSFLKLSLRPRLNSCSKSTIKQTKAGKVARM